MIFEFSASRSGLAHQVPDAFVAIREKINVFENLPRSCVRNMTEKLWVHKGTTPVSRFSGNLNRADHDMEIAA